MTKKELKRYRAIEREIETLETYIRGLERKAAQVPVVKDKVQSSQKEWPFIETHVTVDAPEPHQYTKIQRLIIRNEALKDELITELTRLDSFIHSIDDPRGQAILIAVYINGKSQAQVAIDMDLSYQRVSNIITEILKKY